MTLAEGSPPLVSVTPNFKPGAYFSHITGIRPSKSGSRGSQFTAKNERLDGILRPHTFTAGDVKGGELEDAVRAKLGRMFANIATYSAVVVGWRDDNGDLLEENKTIKLTAPSAMIYQPYEFLIRNLDLRQGPDVEYAVLNLVLPGVFSGEIPGRFPWDE